MRTTILIITLLLALNNLSFAQKSGGCDLCGPSGNSQNQASGNYSVTAGMKNISQGSYSVAFGLGNKTVGAGSFALGRFVRANATNAFVIGCGTDNTDTKALINNYSGTLMIGFNSRYPTLFVGSSTSATATGKIGIGNITSPKAKLHMLADSNEDAGLILEPSNKTSKKAFLQLCDANHVIEVSKNGMKISSTNDLIDIDAQNIKMMGKVGINTDNNFTGDYEYTLAVKGGVLTSEVYVKEVDEWHDYVFDDNYDLIPLEKLEKYVRSEKHLPDLPSEKEILDHGYNISEMDGMLLKKIEELTLYAVALQRQLDEQQLIINKLQEAK